MQRAAVDSELGHIASARDAGLRERQFASCQRRLCRALRRSVEVLSLSKILWRARIPDR